LTVAILENAGFSRSHVGFKSPFALSDFPSLARGARADLGHDHRRLHESLQNVTLTDVYEARQAAILERRARIKWEK